MTDPRRARAVAGLLLALAATVGVATSGGITSGGITSGSTSAAPTGHPCTPVPADSPAPAARVRSTGAAVVVRAAPSVVDAGVVRVAPSAADAGVTRTSPPAVRGSLTVFAAASLADAFADVAEAWSAMHPESTLVLSTGASSTLRAQVEQGAPADVFASADAQNPQALVDAGLAVGPVVPFAGNTLALIVPADNPACIRSPTDLGRPNVRVVAAGDAVPVTMYARALLRNLAAVPGYPAGFAEQVETNTVSREDNVGAVAAKVALGEADAGIVYASDVLRLRDVLMVPIPVEANATATYGAVVVASSRQPAAAAGLLAWLAGPDGQRLLASHGFLPAP